MKLSELARAFSPWTWVAAIAAAVLFLLIAWWVVIGGPAHDRKAAAEARASSAYAAGRTDAALDAAAIIDQARTASAANEDLARKTADEIHAAPGANQPLDPALNRTARERLCQRSGLRGTADCVQLLGRAKPAG